MQSEWLVEKTVKVKASRCRRLVFGQRGQVDADRKRVELGGWCAVIGHVGVCNDREKIRLEVMN